MRRILEISYKNKGSSFTVTKINRSKIYGSKKRVPIDAGGGECSRAGLTRDGKYILPNAGTASLYLDKDGDVVERNQFRGVDADGEAIAPVELVPDAAMGLAEAMEASEILECSITHAYALEVIFLSSELEASLSQGSIYCLPDFNDRRAFLVGNEAGYFLLIGNLAGFKFIGLVEADLSPPDLETEDIDEDLDFSMF